MASLLGRVVMVTGAVRGTGRVHCERFADEGADVIALDAAAAAFALPQVPIGGIRRARQLADWTLFMLSDAADFLCGSVVFVDGDSDSYLRSGRSTCIDSPAADGLSRLGTG